MHPVMLQMQKVCTEEYTLPKFGNQKEGVKIYPGTTVIIPVQSIHRYFYFFSLSQTGNCSKTSWLISAIQIFIRIQLNSIHFVLMKVNERTGTKLIICHSAKVIWNNKPCIYFKHFN